ncbi:hypothetical protein DMH18_17520 [Streptomyces sp. WAC 06783]|nr:hypothetical protein DMH18_17520 [Streptomyces sp. WAC 06783]
MIEPARPPEQRERLEQLADACRLWMALYPSPKPPPLLRHSRSRRCSSGRPNSWQSTRRQHRRHWR